MAEEKIEKATAADIPRLQMSEQGVTGLRASSGIIFEDIKTELSFPQSIITYKQMSYDPTIAAGLSYYEAMMQKPKWYVNEVKDATAEEKAQARFIEECMSDMVHTWNDMIREASSMNVYGFAVQEIVLRKRLRSKGSKYNDGKIGWQSLPTRSQDSIKQWIFDDDGRELLGLEQSTVYSPTSYRVMNSNNTSVIIPRKKFLLFRTGAKKDNPEGSSLLKACYYPWKMRVAIEETEGVGIFRDLSGFPVISIPPQYMSEDSTPEQKAVYAAYKNIVRNVQSNQQGGVVMPMAYDPDTKQPLFKFELMSAQGGKAYDTSQVITRYNNSILTAMCCDLLTMGQGATGSYALGSIKSSMTAMTIESRLREIRDVINHHLIPMTAEYNGWDITRLPTIDFEDLEVTDLDQISKFLQRVGAVGYLPRTPEVINKVLDALGLDALPEGTDLDDVLPEKTTKSGQGMEEGLSSGTGNADGASGDASSTNSDNAS